MDCIGEELVGLVLPTICKELEGMAMVAKAGWGWVVAGTAD